MSGKEKVQCAKCKALVCVNPGNNPEWPADCPMRTRASVIEQALAKFSDEDHEFTRVAAEVESESYQRGIQGIRMFTPRVQEIINFAKKMGYKKLGLAHCVGVMYEAKLMTDILEYHGFEVSGRACKVGLLDKKDLGLKPEELLFPDGFEAACHPILQAELLNDGDCDLNIAMGQCLGHDTLFLKYSKFPTTGFLVKDRVLGHNPILALQDTESPYYNWSKTKTLDTDFVYGSNPGKPTVREHK
ncbi:DUF1847 domain-containing protein [Chloroflexota bacterium]